MRELIKYEWDPETEIATLHHEYDGRVTVEKRHQPLEVEPLNYWTNLARYLLITGQM